MATIEINGKDVEVDDNFHNLSEADQHAAIEHISDNMDQNQSNEYYNKPGAAAMGAIVGASPNLYRMAKGAVLGASKGFFNTPQSSVTVSSPVTGVPVTPPAAPVVEPWKPTHGGEQWVKGSTGVELPGAQMEKAALDQAKSMAHVVGRGGEFAGGEIKSGIILPPEKTLAERVAMERAALREQQLSEIGQTAAKKYLAQKAAEAAAAAANPSFGKKALDLGKSISGKVLTAAEPVLKVAGPIAGGAAAGEQYMDMLERMHHGDIARGVVSGLGAAGSAVSAVPFLPPPVRAIGAGVGIAAPGINYLSDKVYGRSGYADGGSVQEPSLADAAKNIYGGLTDPKQLAATGDALGRLRQSIPGVAESVVRGAAATVPGVFGDIESLGRAGINAFQTNLGKLSGTNQGTVSPETTLPTTRDVLNYVPRYTPKHEGAETLEDVGAAIAPGMGVLAKDTAMLTKGLPVGLSIQDVSKGRVFAPKNELGAYSALEEAALNLKQNKGTGDQLYNMLVKEPGVKQEELQYRGLDALLKGKNEPMTKEGILAHLQENKLPGITERKLGDKYATEGEPDYNAAIDDFHSEWRNAARDDDAWDQEYNYRRYDDTDWHDQRKQEYMEEHGLDEDAFNADNTHQENVDKIIAQDAVASADDYDPWTITHRNSDYEIRGNGWGDIELHGPEGHIDNYSNIEAAQQAAIDHALENGHLEPEYIEGPGASQYHGYKGEGNGNYEEQLFHYSPLEGSYRAPHFENESENLLMHMRRQDAENPQGKKIFKIEEQQSDWHQKGRDQGYKSDFKTVNWMDPEYVQAREDAMNALNAYNSQSGNPEIQKTLKAEMERTSQLERNFADRNNKHSRAVPDAPFKKNWNEFLMKKALHDAAVGGYDKLAWTTGQTQAQRYNKMLADNVSEIHYTKTPQGHYVIAFKRPGETSFTPYQNSIGEDALKDHFGEHIADQIKNNTGETIPYLTHHPEGTAALREMGTSGYHFKTPGDMETFTGFGNSPEEAKADLIKTIPRLADKHIIKGENMSFGSGKGMQGFYDKMQADFLNKFAKKYGQKVHQDQVLGNMNPETVNALTITPEMRAELMERGFPMYKKGGIVKK